MICNNLPKDKINKLSYLKNTNIIKNKEYFIKKINEIEEYLFPKVVSLVEKIKDKNLTIYFLRAAFTTA